MSSDNSDQMDETQDLSEILEESTDGDETAVDETAVDETAVAVEETDDDGESESESRHAAPRKRRGVLLAVGLAAALTLGAAGTAIAAAHKTVEIDVDGQAVTVSTFAGDVGNLLEAQGIVPGEHDLVVPGVDEPLTEGAEIVIRTAEQIGVTIDGEASQVWTVGDTAAQALSALDERGTDVQMAVSRTSGRPALDLPLVADGPVTFVADGEERTVDISGVADLATALLQAEIELGASDQVSVSANDAGVPVVTVTRIATEEDTRTEAIDFETVEQGTDDLYEGETRVASEGAEGERTYTFVNYEVDGEVISSRLVSVEVTTEPEDRVVEYGTAQRPVVQAPAPSDDGGDSGGDSGGGGTVTGDVWAALAQCESGGNPTTNTGNGYYGLYQFSLGTWQSLGGTGLPSEASAAEQTRLAQMLQARSGWGQWPACAAKLGLL